MQFSPRARLSSAFVIGALLSACGSSGGGPASGTGGSASGTGGQATGGTTATGGSTATGGATGTGGVKASGGSTGTGGVSATGGAPGAGGARDRWSGDGWTAGRGGPGAAATGGSAGSGPGAGGAAGGSSGTDSCPATVLKSGDSNMSVTVGSTSRTYILHVPSAYKGTAAVPLVVDFHPLGGSGSSEESCRRTRRRPIPKASSPPIRTASRDRRAAPGTSGPAASPTSTTSRSPGLWSRKSRPRPASTRSASTRSVSRWAAGCPTTSRATRPILFAAVAPASFDLLAGKRSGLHAGAADRR